jgi:hypothetical protein
MPSYASSLMSQRSCARANPATAVSCSRESTRPLGLLGLLTYTATVDGVSILSIMFGICAHSVPFTPV